MKASVRNSVVAGFREKRLEESKHAEQLVLEEANKFIVWSKAQDVVPTIIALRKKFEEVAEQEVERMLPSLNGSMEESKDIIQNLARSVINKLLHVPTSRLKSIEDYLESKDRPFSLADAAIHLFDLEPQPVIEDKDEKESADSEQDEK